MRLKLSIIMKLAALLAAAVVLTAFAVNEVYVRGSNKILVSDAIADLEHETEFFKYPLADLIHQLKDDNLLLARLPGFPHMNALPQTTASTFAQMLRTHGHYLKISYMPVAQAGKQVWGFRRRGDDIERVAPGGDADDPVFAQALRLGADEVYLSSPALDRRQGSLVIPYTLLLRSAAKVYDEERHTLGVVTIDMDLGAALADLKQQLLAHRVLYVTNSSGDYLLHPDTSRLYASELGHDNRIQRDYPKVLVPMNDPKLDTASFLSDETADGKALAFLEYHYDPLRPDEYIGISVGAPYRDIVAKTTAVETRGMLFSLIIAAFALVSATLLLRVLIRPLGRVADAVVRYRKGEKHITLPVDSPDEIGVLAREFHEMMRQKGDEEWVKENLVSIAKGLLGFKDLESFSAKLMQALTQALDAEIGAIYITGDFMLASGRREPGTLMRAAVCGAEKPDALPQAIRYGEGLMGHCAKYRTPKLLSDVPDDYLDIASALGRSRPRTILIMPVLYENRLAGVIEIASLHEFSDIHYSFLNQLCFTVGVIINSISASQRTQELLEEARLTAEELQRSEEELKTQQEELQASNEEMEEKTHTLEEQNARILQQSRELEESKRLIEVKAQELERSNTYKSEFLANMSHELRTPLNSLLILSRGLAANEEGNLTAEQMEEADVIHSGGLELLGLINDILDLSKVEAGKISILPQDVLLGDIVKRMQQQFEPVARESGVRFVVKAAADLPRLLFTDTQRVEQVLKNLLSNAFKFTEKGSVTFEVKRAPDSARAIAFSVHDTGIGIEASKLHDIFEAFQQEDGSIDRHYGGTGLGLTIARKFAQLLGGEIKVTSVKGKGSSFTLVLPVALAANGAGEQETPPDAALPEAAETNVQPLHPPAEPREKLLLIIEDDPHFAEVLTKIAQRYGYKCLHAYDGKTGLMLAADRPVSAVLLDVKLPDIDGMQVLARLKDNLKTRHIPVHVLTACEADVAAQSLRSGAIGCLTKPLRKEDIDGVFTRIEGLLQARVKKVLAVEDDRKTQTAIGSLLRKKDIEITFCGRGAEALRQLRSTAFDCIILDLHLPDMTGFEWLDEVEKQAPSAQVPPVIVYTACELTEEETRRLSHLTSSIVIKGASSSGRLLDEVTLFLHSVESGLSRDQQDIIRMQHNPDTMLEGRVVLLVDDDLRNSFALSKILKKRGMRVVVADNGRMALEKLREDAAIELVITDIMMPIMDGYQTIAEIRARPEWQELPILALTARAMPEEQEKCMKAGANDYLTKPVDVDRLLALLRVWLFRQERAA